MTPSICIRESRAADDYDSAVRLWNGIERGVHVGRSDTRDEIEKKLQRDPDLFLVAEADGALVGTVIGGFDGRRGFIYHLAVDASQRGQGLGSRLMEEVESRLRSRECLRCYLLVTPDNAESMRFYENHGWALMDVFPFAKDLA